jgi:hypothetical protein
LVAVSVGAVVAVEAARVMGIGGAAVVVSVGLSIVAQLVKSMAVPNKMTAFSI